MGNRFHSVFVFFIIYLFVAMPISLGLSISDVSVVANSNNAQISWKTDEPSQATLLWGENSKQY